eukprot:3935545-Rhodomonas_salina.4
MKRAVFDTDRLRPSAIVIPVITVLCFTISQRGRRRYNKLETSPFYLPALLCKCGGPAARRLKLNKGSPKIRMVLHSSAHGSGPNARSKMSPLPFS